MKILVFAFIIYCIAALISCKEKESKNQNTETLNKDSGLVADHSQNKSPNDRPVANNEAKNYTVSFNPSSIELGKNNEALITLKNGKALDLVDADGKITGTEFTYDIDLKNKNDLGGSSINISPYNFRLQLDNDNIIIQERYNSVSADAQSTNSSTGNKFRLPPGTKPKTLSLFFDETRATVNVSMR
jgi:hypothetical protein